TLVGGGGTIQSETVWNEGAGGGATGGGYSTTFARPPWQAGGAGRGVPDVAGDADSNTGWLVRVDGRDEVIGGTSAVARMWAGLVALLNARLGKPVGFLTPLLYQNPGAFRDIVSGNNGAYAAGPGWDPCTGLGSPDGGKLLAALGGGAPAPVPPPTP